MKPKICLNKSWANAYVYFHGTSYNKQGLSLNELELGADFFKRNITFKASKYQIARFLKIKD